MRFPRYANIDVSYLLARMEAVGDLTILATNRKNAPDQTFLLRIGLVVESPLAMCVLGPKETPDRRQ